MVKTKFYNAKDVMAIHEYQWTEISNLTDLEHINNK